MLRLAFDFIITWRETRTRPNAYGEWKTVSGEFRMFFHIILLIYRGILHVIRNG